MDWVAKTCLASFQPGEKTVQSRSKLVSPEVGVAIIKYTQVRKWVWQLQTITIVIHFLCSIVNIYRHDDDDHRSIVACLRVLASALHLNFHLWQLFDVLQLLRIRWCTRAIRCTDTHAARAYRTNRTASYCLVVHEWDQPSFSCCLRMKLGMRLCITYIMGQHTYWWQYLMGADHGAIFL